MQEYQQIALHMPQGIVSPLEHSQQMQNYKDKI
jgi:hypothetical protein